MSPGKSQAVRTLADAATNSSANIDKGVLATLCIAIPFAFVLFFPSSKGITRVCVTAIFGALAVLIAFGVIPVP